MHRADDREAVLRLGVADRVPAGEDRTRRADLRVRGGEHLREQLARQVLRKRGDREREERRPAHREDVVQRVRRGDRAVVGRVVDDRREEIDREDDRLLVVQLVHRRVVGRRQADEQVLVGDRREAAQQLLEERRRVLGCAPPGRGEIGELDGAGCVHSYAPPVVERRIVGIRRRFVQS
jgi:hypothetical protein